MRHLRQNVFRKRFPCVLPCVTEVDIILQSPRNAQLNEHLFETFVTGFTSSLGKSLSVTDIIQLLRGQFLVEVTAWGGQALNYRSKTGKLKTLVLLRLSGLRQQNERVLLLYNGTEPTSPSRKNTRDCLGDPLQPSSGPISTGKGRAEATPSC